MAGYAQSVSSSYVEALRADALVKRVQLSVISACDTAVSAVGL